MEWLLWRLLQSTWVWAACACVCVCDYLCICIFRVCRNNIKAYYISRKCHWLPLHPQRPQRHYNTGQISHYEDEWLHKNTITYHSACRIYYELLTEPKVRRRRGLWVKTTNWDFNISFLILHKCQTRKAIESCTRASDMLKYCYNHPSIHQPHCLKTSLYNQILI